jgi:uncharacterized protein YprB with RNaseH-like and TPR domain
MITRQFPINQMPNYPFENEYTLDKIVFFDIETTGFAANSTFLYLIGCAYYSNHSFHLIQWFSENLKEEALLITSFFEFISNYDVLLHYNGTGFDIPYLQRKCAALNLPYSFEHITSIDLYKKISPFKKVFKLANYKQKTIETFLNIHRKDVFSGGDLIQVYQSYLGKKHFEILKKTRDPESKLPSPSEAEMLLYQLLLHNEDDIKGLLSISPILYYVDLFEKPIRIMGAGVNQDILTIRFEVSASLPVRINFGNDLVHCTAYHNTATLEIRIYEGELKYFYDNYKDYYYLPAEDCVVHKSVAHFVDKEHRQKAKLSNCYVKKQGLYAPQYDMLFTPSFKLGYQDKLSFLEIHTDFLLQEEILEQYVSHILSHIISKADA